MKRTGLSDIEGKAAREVVNEAGAERISNLGSNFAISAFSAVKEIPAESSR